MSYKEANGRSLELRYRIQGAESWSVLSGNPSIIYFPVGGGTFEIEARWFCNAQNSWTKWSATQIIDLNKCLSVVEGNPSFGFSYYAYPDLQVSINIPNFYNFNYRWYYRKKGSQEWVDTIKIAERYTVVANLTPGTSYEFRVDVSCRENSTSFFYTVEMPSSCLSIDSAQVVIKEVYDSSILIAVPYPGRRIYEYRFRAEGESEFTITRPESSRLMGLKPNTNYELNMRVVCEDSIPDWSPSVFFTTNVCNLPYRGDLSVVQSYAPDSILYRADFINFTGDENFQFYWKYKAKDEKNWQRLEVQDKNEALFKNLKKGIKYEVQLSVRCSSNAVDSFSLATSFTALKDNCSEKPDTAGIILIHKKGSHPTIKFKSPIGYDFFIRVKPSNNTYFGYYIGSFLDSYNTSFSIFPDVVNDFQYRYVCPNGNLSPWSDVVKLDNTNNFFETELPQLAFENEQQYHQDQAKMQIRIAPNPSSGQLSILFPEAMEPQPEAHLEILNTAGQRIWSLKMTIAPAQVLPLDLSKQTPGLYILRIQAGQKVYTERIIIASNR